MNTKPRKYFGTDGIRGRANSSPMTSDFVLRVAMAAAVHFGKDVSDTKAARPRALIGKDTRLSGYMFESAMTAGFLPMGMDVIMTGPVPTPAIAMLTRSLRAEVGVMISASHNQFQDNGIKLFGADGRKLSDADELAIEALIDSDDLFSNFAAPEKIGKAKRIDGALERYIEAVKSCVPKGKTLNGMRIVVDCANGAAYKAAPQLLWELEAEVITIGASPDGHNINHECGATSTSNLQKEVVARQADIGIALDGDADRLIVVDESGAVIDGDQVLAALALSIDAKNVVSTVMSGGGLDAFLKTKGITLHRTPVGDRYVFEHMCKNNFQLGGEPSGHIILKDHATTGDGLLAALHVLLLLKDSGKKASKALSFFTPMPQVMKSVEVSRGVLNDKGVILAISSENEKLSKQGGRVLVRPSGTEPIIRVMAEAHDNSRAQDAVDNLCSVIKDAS